MWGLHLALRPKLTPTEFIPVQTPWYLIVSDSYPQGDVKLYPAKQGGITATFQHQSLNERWLPKTVFGERATCASQLISNNWDTKATIGSRETVVNGFGGTSSVPSNGSSEASQDRVAELNEPFERKRLKSRKVRD